MHINTACQVPELEYCLQLVSNTGIINKDEIPSCAKELNSFGTQWRQLRILSGCKSEKSKLSVNTPKHSSNEGKDALHVPALNAHCTFLVMIVSRLVFELSG